jgi:outer membrane cobalamin receptor
VKLLNITDRDYSLAYGYNTMGRAGFLELTFKL